MKKIEYSLSTIKSLHAMSLAGSEDEEIVEIDDEDETQLGEEENSEAETLSMSDEEFEKLDESSFESTSEEEVLGDDDEGEQEVEVNEDEADATAEEEATEQTTTEEEPAGNQPSDEELAANAQAYEAAYQQLFGQPIKASGREVQLKDIDQVRNLVEMGIDYNKKMQHMRPHQQTLKTLEKQGLLGDSEKLNLLLEAQQGKPEAIKRLIAEANIDIVDMADDDNATDYRPEDHIVSQAEVDIEHAFESISKSPAYQRTIDVMRSTFDAKSREQISENPTYITALNSDIETGLYDKVIDMVQYQRDIKAIPDSVSDIDAYIGTVQQMAQQEQQQAQAQHEAQAEPTQQASRSTGSSRKRKAAMSGSRGARKKKEQNFDPMDALSMSDDAFEKQFGDQLL